MMRAMSAQRKRWAEVALLTAGLLLRWYFVWHRPGTFGDAQLYGELARNLLQHHVYGLVDAGQLHPTLIRLPGYPVFLAACFAVFGVGNFLAALWVQVAVDLVGWWWLSRLVRRMFGERAGWAALALGTLCPFVANYTAVALTETLVLFTTVVALVGLERWMASGGGWNRWLWVTGAALVYSVMLRPDQGLLGVAVVGAMAWTAWRQRRVGPVLTLCMVMVLPFLLWGGRNARELHRFEPLAPRWANDPGESVPYGFNKWYRTWAIDFKASDDFYWNWDGDGVRMRDLPARAIDNEAQRQETQRIFALYAKGGNNSTPAVEEAFLKLANERVKANPLRYYVYVPTLKVVNMFLRPRTELLRLPMDWWNFRAHPKGSWIALGWALWSAAYLALAWVGARRWWRDGGKGVRWGAMGWV
ncbi:MAG: glycosyltransferase family 39 protein, partial [Bryocella sp.]